jgi:hypothetical protein
VLPESLQASVFAYLSSVDERLPGRVSGLYVVGSAALGDFSERVSNVDVVVVSDQAWSEADLAVAVSHHGGLKQGRPPVVAYVVAGDLILDPRLLQRHCYEGGTLAESERLVNPLTWDILGRGALDLRGPDHAGGWDESGVIKQWAADQLRTTWATKLAHLDRLASMWFRHELSAAVLDVARLAVAANSGTMLSKTEAVRVLEPDVPGRFRRILTDSVGYRGGGKTSMYWGPLERKQNAMELIHELVTTAPV